MDGIYKADYISTMNVFGALRGVNAELRLIEAWKPRWHKRQPHQQWFIKIFTTDHWSDADSLGVDAILQTKFNFDYATLLPHDYSDRKRFERLLPFGSIPLQVKSSAKKAKEFRLNSKGAPIPVVVINENHVFNKQIRDNTIKSILFCFPKLGEQMKRFGCGISPQLFVKKNAPMPIEVFA